MPCRPGLRRRETGKGDPAEPIRVMLADDPRIVREGLAGILRAEPDIALVAEAADGREAVELAEDARPDVVVMDVAMSGMDGEEARRAILRDHPEVRVIGLLMYEGEDLTKAVREGGASEYLTKGEGPAGAFRGGRSEPAARP